MTYMSETHFEAARPGIPVIVRTLNLLAGWQERVRQRRRLSQLDDRMLSDIGIDRGRAMAEYRKPFWQA